MNSEISKLADYLVYHITKSENEELKRVLHGRGQSFEEWGYMNVDLFTPALLITLYEAKDYDWKSSLATELLEKTKLSSIVYQDRSAVPWKNEIFGDDLPEKHIIVEKGLRYTVSLKRGENPGLFPDMAEGRFLLRSLSQGKRVLNLFSYTCAFSVAALAGGADFILNMDMNRNSLSRGRENHRLNDHDLSKVQFLSHNILKSFGKIKKSGPFDLIVIDPPPSQGESFKLERDYGKILRKSREFLADKGEIIACLNSPKHDFPWFKDFITENLGACEFFSELDGGESFPEVKKGGGLKIYHLRPLSIKESG